MDNKFLYELLERLKKGEIDTDAALDKLKILPFEDIGYAKLDHHRNLRKGFPEVVFCEGKTSLHISEIIKKLALCNSNVLATRASRDIYTAVSKICPEAQYHELARCITINNEPIQKYNSSVLVISAGTADIPVAEEAAVTTEIMGGNVTRLYDVGVAGIHRLFSHHDLLRKASVIIVTAGMEGALATVIAGLVNVPVIAVPTSIGYGASFGGLAALLAMLNSCASGIAVVNIDNGFGAAAMASSIIRLAEKN
ncbi:nickel pincer cofactor biosynthesis protein LarB [Phosphitispora sp. TUW77]|uniref:nickel pincer cofactor biosynthesis protein LarB n=1 Tax=Phosphitispora sp. TUW77 TaxID=3152361 RepID=UPI003AB72A8B